jgi:transcriptional regulator with XRE-family HTH domain
MTKNKFLTEEELIQFIDWCKANRIRQRQVAKLAGLQEQWVSQIFRARKNRNGEPNQIKKPSFLRARAKLVLLQNKKRALEAGIRF